jgi:cytochrome c oxidase subunit 4
MERDDIIEYSLDAHHSEEVGKSIRKKIWNVTILLTLITAIEVVVGAKWGRATTTGTTWQLIKYGYIVLTLVKAAYIVLVFMHLGDERKSLKYVVLVPYILFILYLIFIALMEALAVGNAWSTYGG